MHHDHALLYYLIVLEYNEEELISTIHRNRIEGMAYSFKVRIGSIMPQGVLLSYKHWTYHMPDHSHKRYCV